MNGERNYPPIEGNTSVKEYTIKLPNGTPKGTIVKEIIAVAFITLLLCSLWGAVYYFGYRSNTPTMQAVNCIGETKFGGTPALVNHEDGLYLDDIYIPLERMPIGYIYDRVSIDTDRETLFAGETMYKDMIYYNSSGNDTLMRICIYNPYDEAKDIKECVICRIDHHYRPYNDGPELLCYYRNNTKIYPGRDLGSTLQVMGHPTDTLSHSNGTTDLEYGDFLDARDVLTIVLNDKTETVECIGYEINPYGDMIDVEQLEKWDLEPLKGGN